MISASPHCLAEALPKTVERNGSRWRVDETSLHRDWCATLERLQEWVEGGARVGGASG